MEPEVGYGATARFTRGFKLEAVKLVTERGVTIAQAARDLEVSGQVLRRWVKELESRNRIEHTGRILDHGGPTDADRDFLAGIDQNSDAAAFYNVVSARPGLRWFRSNGSTSSCGPALHIRRVKQGSPRIHPIKLLRQDRLRPHLDCPAR